MADFIERATLQVDGVDLDDIILAVAESSDRPTKPVNTMNKARIARGFKQGNNQYSLDIDAERIVDPRVPDWHKLKDDGTPIKIAIRYNIGKPVTYSEGKVTSVKDTTSDGDSARKVTCVFRKRKQ